MFTALCYYRPANCWWCQSAGLEGEEMIRCMKLSVELVGSARHTTADHCPYDRVPFSEVMHCAGWDAGSVPRDICCYCGAHTSQLPVPDRCRDLPFPVAVSHCQFLYATIVPFSDCMASVTSRSLGSVLEGLTLSPGNCYSRSTKRGF